MKKLFSAAVLTLLLGSPILATTFVRVSDEALVDDAAVIVVGRVESRSTASDGRPATEYGVRIEEALKGAASEQLTVTVPGGGSGPVKLKVWGAPSFRPGERVLLFLQPASRGDWAVHHLFLGAFHEVTAGERRLAVRDLSEVSEVRMRMEGQADHATSREPVRDFDAFRSWVARRVSGAAEGIASVPAYSVTGDEAAELRRAVDAFTLFEDELDGLNIRWFTFDGNNPGNVKFRAKSGGQDGVSGGGFSELQTAIAAWNGEANTPIDYRYSGTTTTNNSLGDGEFDGVNSVIFNDPNNVLGSFSCASGGVLALGGVWYGTEDPRSFQGQSYWPVIGADIVTNNGLSCFFASSPNASKAAQEVFGHELGHTLGIGHSCGDPGGPSCNNATFNDALMRAFVHDDDRGATLKSDDRAAAQALYEQGASSTPPAAPTGLTGSATSISTILLQWNDNANNETDYRVEMKQVGTASYQELELIPSGSPELPVDSESITVTGLASGTGYFFRTRAHNDAGFSPYSNEVLVATDSPIAPCVEDTNTLCVNNDRFAVELDWRTPDGNTGVGSIVPLPSAPDSGLFYFFSPSNVEMLVKVLNACVPSVGNKYWVFFAATTNVEFTLTVTDTQTGKTKVYFNPLNSPAPPVQDTEAFATCP